MQDEQAVELSELLAEVRRIDVQAKRLVTDIMAGGYTSAFRGSGLEFDGVREYVEGDARRHVDWNVTARVGRPFVKTFVDERDLTVLFLLDCSPSMAGGFGHWSARQMAARICACLAFSAVRNNDKVGFIAFGEDVDSYVPPKKGAGHALRIVRDCLARPASKGQTDFDAALRFASRVVRRHAVVFLVSDFLAEGWERPLALCARRHDLVAVRMLAPELEAPDTGLMAWRDPESDAQGIVDWSSPRVRAAYAERVAAEEARVVDALQRARVDRLDVPMPRAYDADAIARPILRFFRMRAQRGAKR
ncbi:MAG: DUF58 domain-containing protein [Planctomycetota bacterium]